MIGTILNGQNGQYQLESKIGEGAYGVVYKAINSATFSEIAVKVLIDAQNREAGDRMRREILIVSQLNHNNIIRVLDYGIGPSSMYWFAMPYMKSGSLDKKIVGDHSARFELINIVKLIRGIADGLSLYHQQGGIHRDIKPENILIDIDGTPKLADFGVARCPPQLINGNMTQSPLGTPNYMAPEVFQGKVCEKSDIYSLGVVFWELLHWKRRPSALTALTFERAFEPQIDALCAAMTSADLNNRPDAEIIAQKCDLLIAQFQRKQEAPKQTVTQESSSGWGWLLGMVAAAFVADKALANKWDGDAQRYRGSDGRFRGGRWS